MHLIFVSLVFSDFLPDMSVFYLLSPHCIQILFVLYFVRTGEFLRDFRAYSLLSGFGIF